MLAKRAGAACSCADFRSILVETAPAKLYHRHLRGLLVPFLAGAVNELQAGAVPGTGIESLSLLARAFQALASAHKRQWAVLLYDIKAAFYRVLRQLLVAVPDTDGAIQHLVQSMGLPPAALVELRDKLLTLEALADAKVPSHVQALLTDIMQGTYFRMDGHHLLHLTRKGTRPGDPTADVCSGSC